MSNINQKIQELIDAGICTTVEEARQFLETTGVSRQPIPLSPEGYSKLAFYSGHSKANFTKYNRAAKNADHSFRFEEGRFYLGTIFEKNTDKSIDLENTITGTDLGPNPEIIIISKGYFGNRYIPGAHDNVTSTIGLNLSLESQRLNMLDFKNSNDILSMRKELEAEYGSRTKIPQDRKIKFITFVMGVVLVDGKWEKFWNTETLITFDNDTYHNFFQEIENTYGFPSAVKASYQVEEKDDGYGKKCVVINKINYKEHPELTSYVQKVYKDFQEFLRKQHAHVEQTSKKEVQETSLERTNIDESDLDADIPF